MTYQSPFVAHGAPGITNEEIRQHTEDYRRVVIALGDGMFDLETMMSDQRTNVDLDRITS